MPSRVVHRAATEVEQAALREMLANWITPAGRWKRSLGSAVVLWAVSLLGLVLIWLACAWLGRKLFNFDIGLHSSAGPWILAALTSLCAVYAVMLTVRWVKGWKDYRPLLRADVEAAQVAEEQYVFTAAKRFQEPEHGGLIYFLRTVEDKVFVLFDHESQDLGVQEGDPLKSSFRPKSELVMIRAPRTTFVIDKIFSGDVLDAGDPLELCVPPEDWPETESYCDIPWAELEARLGPAEYAKAS